MDPSAYFAQLRRSTALVESPPAALENALVHPRLVLVGPGTQAFLRHLAHLWCCCWEDTRTAALPFPILVERASAFSPSQLIDYLNAQNRDRGWQLPEDFFASRLAHGACVLLLDGLSRPLLEQAPGLWPHCRFVVAARPEELPAPGGFTIVEI